MYRLIRERATTRQVRLFMVACCRLMATAFFDPRIPAALEAAEQCADDPDAEARNHVLWDELITGRVVDREKIAAAGKKLGYAETEMRHLLCVIDAWQLLQERWAGTEYREYRNVQQAISHAAYLCLRDHPNEIFTGGEGNAAEHCAWAIDSASALASGETPEQVAEDVRTIETEIRKAIAHALRDVFGNPYRPNPTRDPGWFQWNHGALPTLAVAAYESRSPHLLTLDPMSVAVLGDALEDAGCTDAEILDHLRNPGPHVRGCWAVDLLLGKS
jgi:hypothetical protein